YCETSRKGMIAHFAGAFYAGRSSDRLAFGLGVVLSRIWAGRCYNGSCSMESLRHRPQRACEEIEQGSRYDSDSYTLRFRTVLVSRVFLHTLKSGRPGTPVSPYAAEDWVPAFAGMTARRLWDVVIRFHPSLQCFTAPRSAVRP